MRENYDSALDDLEKENAILWKRVKKLEETYVVMADTMKKLSLRMRDLYLERKHDGKIVTLPPKDLLKV